jgi:hypothetical protein
VANPIAIAAKGKGYSALAKRARAISERYGLTAAKMDRALRLFVSVLQDYDCGATFPITGSALACHGPVIQKYQAQNIEFAIHGLFHIDYSTLSLDEQANHLKRARQIFHREEIDLNGFRCPYLRWNPNTLAALRQQGFAYDGSQGLTWDVLDGYETPAYRRVLNFYGTLPASDYPSLPSLEDNLVRIPYCLPDDEALVERLQLTDTEPMTEIWLAVLRRTYESGELFALGLHPERIASCEGPLRAVLSQARSLSPTVWIARLDEIARWWRSRTEKTTYQVMKVTEDSFRLIVNGPPGTTILARSVVVGAPTKPWINGYRRVLSNDFVFRTDKLPFIGLSLDSPSTLTSFLQQQGYLVATSADAQSCAFRINRLNFNPEDKRPLLTQVERGTWPLLRLARWPDGAQSALSVTGDIDALTLWDYVLRVFA